MRVPCFVIVMAFLTAISGCTLFWEGGYKIQERSKDRFEVVWYDPLLASQAMIQLEVKKHCESFNAKPEIVEATSGLGIVSNKEVYKCVSK